MDKDFFEKFTQHKMLIKFENKCEFLLGKNYLSKKIDIQVNDKSLDKTVDLLLENPTKQWYFQATNKKKCILEVVAYNQNEIPSNMMVFKLSDINSNKRFFVKMLQDLNIEVLYPFSVYENSNQYVIDMEGNVYRYNETLEEITLIENGLQMLIFEQLSPKYPQKRPSVGDTYYYKVYNYSTKTTEIKTGTFSNTLDLYNFEHNNYFRTKELCERFAVVTI